MAPGATSGLVSLLITTPSLCLTEPAQDLNAFAHTWGGAVKIAPLVPEHACKQLMQCPATERLPVAPRERLSEDWFVPQTCLCDHKVVPKYAQLLYVSPCPGKKGNKDSSGNKDSLWLDVAWGIPFSPEEFVQKALEAQHPRTLPALLPEALSVALKMVAQHTPAAVATHRARWFAKWIELPNP